MATSKPDLTRVWASNADPSDVVDPDTTTPNKVINGWTAEIPPYESFNYIQKWFSQGLAYNNEQGINEWDVNTTYPIGALVKGSDGVIYQAAIEQNGNNPTSDYVNWYPFSSPFNSVADLKSSSLPEGIKVGRYYYEKGDAGYAEGVVKTAAQAATDGDIIDGYYNVTLANGNVWVGENGSIIEQFGAKGNYDGITGYDDSPHFKAWIENGKSPLTTNGRWYNLGTITGDAALASITRDVIIDFNNAKISCAGQTDATYTATVLIKATDCTVSYRNLQEFNDRTFADRGDGRGVGILTVDNVAKLTYGYSIDNVVIRNGQSFATFYSADPTTYKAFDIYINPNCAVIENSERGITLSGSGERVTGGFTLAVFKRAVYIQDVSFVDLKIKAGTGEASSGNLYVIGTIPIVTPRSILLSLDTGSLRSASLIATDPACVFDNIHFKIKATTIPDVNNEIIRVGEMLNGSWLPTGSFGLKNSSFEMISDVNHIEFGFQTASANIEPTKVITKGSYLDYAKGESNIFIIDDKYYQYDSVDIATESASINTLKILKAPAEGVMMVTTRVRNASNQYKDQKTWIQYTVNSSGDMTIVQATPVTSAPVGGLNPTISYSTSANNLLVSCDTFTGQVSITNIIELDIF